MPLRATSQRATICQLLFGLEFGGAEVLAADIASAGSPEFRFVFGCLDHAGPLADELQKSGHIVEVFHRKPGFDPRCVFRLAAFIKKEKVSLVHAHMCDPFLYSALARLLSPRFPIVMTEHGRPLPDVRKFKRVVLNRLLLRRSDRLVGVGQNLTQPLVENEGFPRGRIEVVYNGRDMTRFRLDHSARKEVRESLGYQDDDFLVIQVARLSSEKDHETSIRAIQQLAPQYPSLRQVIVGDGSERLRIKSLVAALGLEDRIKLLGARSDVERLLSAADVLVLSSLTEAIPLTLIEAMATGLPCVATRVGGIPEVIIDNESGFLTEPKDYSRFAECIEALITDPERRRRMGRLARRRAEECFDRDTMTSAYFRIYREALDLSETVRLPQSFTPSCIRNHVS